jgi:hypothetical protein
MGKDLIGKRVRVQIGGEPPKDDDAIGGLHVVCSRPFKH